MGKKKLLHILYSGQGGLGTYFMNFVKSDQNGSFDHFALFYGIEPLLGEYEQFCQENDIGYSYIEKSSKFDSKAYRKCNKFINANEIELVMLHTFSMTPFYFKPFKKYRVCAVDHTNHRFKTKVEWLFTAINHLFAHKMIYFYEGQFKNIKKSLPFLRKGKNSCLIPKTIDTGQFKPGNLKSGVSKIGMTSRLIGGKRHELLIEAVKSLKNEGIEISLAIAGAGPKENDYKRLVSELRLESNVNFTGNLSQSEIVEFYQSLDIYIHASNGETICYSIMEAQACGLPILASNVEGINDVIEQNKSGLLFENSVESIVEQVKRLINDVQLCQTLGKTSRYLAVSNQEQNNPARRLAQIVS